MTKPNVIENFKAKGKKKKCEELRKFFYNNEDHSVCSRTLKSWACILFYYFVYYAVTYGIFGILLSIFIAAFVSKSVPYRNGQNSMLKLVAAANVYPLLAPDSALVILPTNVSDPQYTLYKNAIHSLLNVSFNKSSPNAVNCPTDGDQPLDLTKFCRFTNDQLGPCADPIGQMSVKKLCVYIRVNKVFGWLPKPQNTTVTTDVLVNCTGQNPGDTFALGQPVYYPSLTTGSRTYGVIGSRFFPFLNQPGYASPMAAVQFPNMKINVAILITCQISNLENSYQQTNLEVMVYDKPQ